jgi:hypothetical protein
MKLRAGLALLLLLLVGSPLEAAEARVLKVLPLYLDSQGRHALSPSLFERDAYQNKLRNQRDLQSGLKVDVQFRASGASTNLQVKVELRTQPEGKPATETVLTAAARPTGLFSRWQSVRIDGEQFKALGALVAWRATLWDGDRQLAEEKSFLW